MEEPTGTKDDEVLLNTTGCVSNNGAQPQEIEAATARVQLLAIRSDDREQWAARLGKLLSRV